MAFSENLKRERERHGLSQGELAEKLCISQAAVSMYENGITSPTVSLAVLIAQTLGTTCEELVNGRETVKQDQEPVRKR